MLDNLNFSSNLLNSHGFVLTLKVGFIAVAVLYFIFSLVVIRQVNLMSETVITKTAPILKILAILHALLALGVVVFFIFFF